MSDPAAHHRGPRSANWTGPELEMLFRECGANPMVALGFNGTDSRARQQRHDFYADIAQRVSALGIGTRDRHAAQRKLVDALKDARTTARHLLSDGQPFEVALAEAMKQVPHVDLLGPILAVAVKATPPGRNTLPRAASVGTASMQRPPTGRASDSQPSIELSASEHATTSQSAASTSTPLAAGEHLMAASRAYPQDCPIAEAMDELSLQSTSTEGGADIWGETQAFPLQQIPVEREEGDTRGGAAAAAPAPASPSAAHDLPEPNRGGGEGQGQGEGGDGGGDEPVPDDAAAAGGVDGNGDGNGDMPVRPRAHGPRARRPLPTHVSGLWAQIGQDFTDSRNAFQVNMDQLKETMVFESTALQTILRGQLDSMVHHLSEISTSLSRMTNAVPNIERNLCLLTDRLLRDLARGSEGVGRGRGQGRGRGRGRGGSVAAGPAPFPATEQAARPATPVAGGSDRAAPAEVASEAQGRARSQRRTPVPSRSVSSPPLPTKRPRR